MRTLSRGFYNSAPMNEQRRTALLALGTGLPILIGMTFHISGSAGESLEERLLRFNNLGIAYLAQYKPAEAERQFRQAVELDPNFVAGHVNIGIAAMAQVHYDDAVDAFKKALAFEGDNIYGHFNLSLLYKLQGETEAALASGMRAVQLDPRDPDIHYQVGSLHMTLRSYDSAIQEFQTVLRLDPNFLSAYYGIGRAYMAKGDADNGRKYIEKHRELQAGAGARDAVGLRYGEQGVYSFAMEDPRKGTEPEPLQPGSVTFTDVTSGSGIAFTHGATERLELLMNASRDPTAAAVLAGSDPLKRIIAPVLGAGIALADVDGDGREDLLFLDTGDGALARSALYLNRGAMRFEPADRDGAPAIAGPAMSAAFGDLDGDADPDLVVVLLDGVQVFLNDGAGRFHDVSKEAGISGHVSKGLLGGVSLADVDHDGDLDVFVAGFLAANESEPRPSGTRHFPTDWPGAANLLFINATGTGPATVKLTEMAAKAKVDQAGRRASGAVFGDFDNDRDIDIALASPGDGTTVYANQRDGTFKDLGTASGLPANALVTGLVSADYDKDGKTDLAATVWDGGTPRLFRNTGASGGGTGGAFAADVSALADVSRQIGIPQFGLAFLDFDNDGYLDLATVNGGDVGPALFLYRNQGNGRFIDAGALLSAESVPARSGRGLAVGDLDQDGDLDLVISNSGAKPTLLRNVGGNKNHWVRIAPQGLHSNKPAVGTRVEIKAGRLWQQIEITAGSGYLSQSSRIPHFGLGPRTRVDTARLLWPGGVLQDEVQVKADAVLAVEELDRKGSSCPILYTWNGKEIAFVSDFLGGSAIGYRTGPGSFNYPDTDEYVKIAADRLVPRDGVLELRFVNQLEETIYFDRARLLAVDHPGDYEIFPDERLMPGPPYPEFRLFAVRDARPPAAAWNDAGRDLREAVSRIDRTYAEPPAAVSPRNGRHFKGYAPEHHLNLDLGEIPAAGPLILLLHGWIDYADSTSNLAAAQAGLILRPPYLEALDESVRHGGDVVELLGPEGRPRRGRWVRVLPQMGFPAGLPKTMTVELTGKLPPGTRLVRIGTTMRIYWDQVRVASELGPRMTVTGLEAATADLRFRGFPQAILPDGRLPEAYDYSADQEEVHWKSHVGAFTRYGDVKMLLARVDDRYVITRPGDEVALEFPSDRLPPLAAGWTRDYLLYADGFGKDMDLNSARPDAVTPLPYHAMRAYPPDGADAYPFGGEELMEYLDTYNTRLVTTPLLPLRSR